jgi:hypothetical protein
MNVSKRITLIGVVVCLGAVVSASDFSRANDPSPNTAKESHWAFRPITKPEPPKAANEGHRKRNPIDAFTLDKLASLGLTFSPDADRRTLIRRVTFDLVGLPPTPAEIAKFISDNRPGAYERVVDRLLASPRFGERWARHWLDVVRFAESDGFETNQPRPNAWPYRDYVIRSFNEDRPYDQFVRDQLAGDQWGENAATGFLVAGPWDRVKSPDPVLTAQQRADELHDMVSTTLSTFMGITVGCARCHDHKFDPIPQRDYYAIKAVFSGVQHGERPLTSRPQHEYKEIVAKLSKELFDIERAVRVYQPLATRGTIMFLSERGDQNRQSNGPKDLINGIKSGIDTLSTGDERGQRDDPGDTSRLPTVSGKFSWWQSTDTREVLRLIPKLQGTYRIWVSWASGDRSRSQTAVYSLINLDSVKSATSTRVIATVDQHNLNDGTKPKPGQTHWSGFLNAGIHDLKPTTAIVLSPRSNDSYITSGPILLEPIDPTEPSATPKIPPLRSSVTRGANVERFRPITAKYVRMTINATNQHEPCIDEFEVFTSGTRKNVALSSAGAKVIASSSLPGNAIHKLEHINDGHYGNSHSWISNEPGRGQVTFELATPESIDEIIWSRDRDAIPRFDDRLAIDYQIETSLDGFQWTFVASSCDRLPRTLDKRPRTVYVNSRLSAVDVKQYEMLLKRQQEITKRLNNIRTVPMVYSGRFGQAETVARFHRGDPMQPREIVAPAGLSQIGTVLQMDPNAPEHERRRAFSEWVTDPSNPLTARVIVNRLWSYHFGKGIVKTPSDFGRNGASPTHPELLDWLASELVQNRWSLKHIHRLIVTSTTYMQSSAYNPISNNADADCRYLWRYPTRRLEAEPIRDSILVLSGKLDLSVGGPGFDLFNPNTNYVKVYTSKTEFGEETFRRMVYQSRPRMQLDDTFGVFDCPDAGQIAPNRHQSITPIQALAMLNSPFVIQQAEHFTRRLIRECGPDIRLQTKTAFEMAVGRPPNETECQAAENLIRQHGLVMFCRALYNSSEFITIR